MSAKFGPGGNSDSFKLAGGKSTLQAPGFVKRIGLDAYEYEAGNGLSASEEMLAGIGLKAKEHGIAMSFHTPYFISLSSVEKEKRIKSVEYIKQSAHASKLLDANIMVVHCGSCAKISRETAMEYAKETLTNTARMMYDCGFSVIAGIETMGKVNQLGTLEEVIELCATDSHLYPVVDFGHMNAREQGGLFPDADSYRRVFHQIAEALGDEKARYMHCHFSKIAYTEKGEKNHLTFEDTVFGPPFEPLMEAIVREGVSPNIICESAGTQADDALAMKNYYTSIN